MCMGLIYFASSFIEAWHQMQIYELIFVLEKEKKCCQPCIITWVAFTLCGRHMFAVNLLDECQLYSCSLKIIHCAPSYPGGATGS